MEEAFRQGASRVWVDPNPLNERAIRLYERLGFVRREMPEDLRERGGWVCLYGKTSVEACAGKRDGEKEPALNGKRRLLLRMPTGW